MKKRMIIVTALIMGTLGAGCAVAFNKWNGNT